MNGTLLSLEASVKAPTTQVHKPWGHEILFARSSAYAGKLLFIRAGHQLSLQYHERKEETIFVHSGRMRFVYEETPGQLVEIEMLPGEAHHIPPGRQHRMIAVEDCTLFEVSTPELDDVVRLQDSYGREGTREP